MVATRIIPCLDIDKGRVVKGTGFVNLVDAGDPVECARIYNQQGADELAVLDIGASHENRATTLNIIERIASEIFIPLTVGGGVRTEKDIYNLLSSGADKVSINTAAISNPSLVSQSSKKFGNQCIVVAIDARQTENDRWQVVSHGGRNATGLDVIEWAQQMVHRGAGEILLTSMDQDGAKTGFDLALTKAVSQAVEVPVIASGGVGTLQHLADGVLLGLADAVLAASIFHYQEHSIGEAKRFLINQGIEVRPV